MKPTISHKMLLVTVVGGAMLSSVKLYNLHLGYKWAYFMFTVQIMSNEGKKQVLHIL